MLQRKMSLIAVEIDTCFAYIMIYQTPQLMFHYVLRWHQGKLVEQIKQTLQLVFAGQDWPDISTMALSGNIELAAEIQQELSGYQYVYPDFQSKLLIESKAAAGKHMEYLFWGEYGSRRGLKMTTQINLISRSGKLIYRQKIYRLLHF